MSVVLIDGMVRVTSCTAIANIAAPTTTELNAGTTLDTFLTPDGLDIGMDTGTVDTSVLRSTFTTSRAGRRKPSIMLKCHHDSPTDTPYLLLVYQAVGFLVVRRGVAVATAYASADKLEVYPYQCGEPVQEKPQPDGTWDFSVPLFVTSDPNTRAVVA